MSQAKVWWYRYQIPTDLNIHRISIKLKIFSYFIDKLHVTNVQRGPDTPPKPVKCLHDFTRMFSCLAKQLINRRNRIPLEVEASENAPRKAAVDTPTAAPIADTSTALSEEREMETDSNSSPPVSKKGGKIIKAE